MGQIELLSWVWHKSVSDGEIPVLGVWGIWSNPLPLWVPGPLWPGEVLTARDPSK